MPNRLERRICAFQDGFEVDIVIRGNKCGRRDIDIVGRRALLGRKCPNSGGKSLKACVPISAIPRSYSPACPMVSNTFPTCKDGAGRRAFFSADTVDLRCFACCSASRYCSAMRRASGSSAGPIKIWSLTVPSATTA